MERQKDLHPLHGQVALVTGASRGIGAAIAGRLAALGAHTILIGRDRKALDAVAESIRQRGDHVEACVYDVTSEAQIADLAAWVGRTFGRIDILINNAGVGCFYTPIHELDPADWDRIINTNLRGVFYAIRAFAPLMIAAKSGHIVNISSIASKNALPNGAAYAASKWGLNGLSYSVAEELRNFGVRVSLICPGSTKTNLGPHTGKDETKMLVPDDVAHAVQMLVTQEPQSFVSEIILRPTRKP